MGALQLEMVRLQGMEKEVQDLNTNMDIAADDEMWNGVKDCFW